MRLLCYSGGRRRGGLSWARVTQDDVWGAEAQQNGLHSGPPQIGSITGLSEAHRDAIAEGARI